MPRTWSLKDQSPIIEMFEELGAMQEGHFQYTSGKHGSVYVAKDLVVPSTDELTVLSLMIADEVHDEMIDTVIGIAPIGAILASYIAHQLTRITARPTFAVFAEKKTEVIHPLGDSHPILKEELQVRSSHQHFIDPEQRVLIVEDIINTGGSVKKLIELVRLLRGEDIWGVANLWNRGCVTAQYLEVENLFSLCDKQYNAYVPVACPLCAGGVPLNTDFGHATK